MPFLDLREAYGATSTILTEYLRESRLDVDHKIATALFYGITAETQDLGREATPADIEAAHFLYPHANKRRLAKIENARVPREYFRVFREAIDKAVLYGDRAVISVLGDVQYPDMVAEVADFLLRLDQVDWAAAIGTFEGCLHCSIRTTERDVNAGEILQRVLGSKLAGGHDQIAGGRIPVGTDPVGARARRGGGARPAARRARRPRARAARSSERRSRPASAASSAASRCRAHPAPPRAARARAPRARSAPPSRPSAQPAWPRTSGSGSASAATSERHGASGCRCCRAPPRRCAAGRGASGARHGRAAEARAKAGGVEREQLRQERRELVVGRRLRARRGSTDIPPGRRRSRRSSSRAPGGARPGWRCDARS